MHFYKSFPKSWANFFSFLSIKSPKAKFARFTILYRMLLSLNNFAARGQNLHFLNYITFTINIGAKNM